MSYRISKRDQDIRQALQRIADDQIGSALHEIASDRLSHAARVHQVRKRCKKLRGLLRLFRKSFAHYDDENRTFRDAARLLSDARDAGSLIETYDALMEHFDAQIERRAFASIRARLTRGARKKQQSPEIAESMERVRQTLEAARTRVPGWRLGDDGFDAMRGGLAKTYKQARSRMAAARAGLDDDAMHEWRKSVKYHWYHARLLREIWPPVMTSHSAAAEDLSELLGDHHDMAVLDGRLRDAPAEFGSDTDIEAFRALLHRRKQVVQGRAFDLGRRLLVERPRALEQRWTGYWDAFAD